MTLAGHQPAAEADRQMARRLVAGLRRGWLLAALLLVWVSVHAFESLGTGAALDLTTGKDTVTYLCLVALAGSAAVLAGARGPKALRALATRPALMLAGWLLVVSLVSDDPATSLRRLVLTGLVFAVAAAPMLLADSQAQLGRCLAVAMTIVLLLCFGGVLLVPDLAIHQLSDVGEPDLAGDWRGVFSHKNEAAAALSLFVFLGVFVARTGQRAWGLGIAAASLVFMLFAGGKSALALVGLTVVMAALGRRLSGLTRATVLLLPLAILLLAGVGSVLVPALGALVHALPVDATFTGRTDVWRFALDNLSGRWLTGHGFAAFWNTPATRYGGEDAGWAGTANHAHNSYLDAVVNGGLPCLAFLLLAFVVQPLRDIAAAERRGADPALLTALTEIWLFSLYLSTMESIFFDQSGPSWFTFLFAWTGLRYAARFRLRRDGAAPAG